MKGSIAAGLSTGKLAPHDTSQRYWADRLKVSFLGETVLPGGLNLRRRAPSLYKGWQRMQDLNAIPVSPV